MDLLAYFRILRRHWVLLAVFVVVGGALGGASTALASGDDGSTANPAAHYKATYTFIFKPDSGTSSYPSSFSNLEQIALLATTGPVPEAVAEQLGASSTQDVAERLTTLTSASAGTVAVTAVGRQPDETAALADTVANELVKNIEASDLASYEDAKADAQKQVDALQAKIDATKAQLGAVPPPPNADVLTQQLAAYQEQYTEAFANYQQVAGKDAPVSPLKTLQEAEAVSIDASEYETRLNQARLGQNNFQAGGNAPVPTSSTSSGASLDGTVPRVVFGAFIGLLLGVGVVMLRDRLDRRVRTREDAEQAFRWPVLADIPVITARQAQEREIVSNTTPLSPTAEAYRSVRSSILFQLAAAERQPAGGNGANPDDGIFEPSGSQGVVLMVASAQPGDGKTTSAANLAAVCAQAGARVLVVNCDFRRPRIHEYFGVDDLPRRVQSTSVPGVSIVTNVVHDEDPNPAQVVGVQRQVVSAARERFDVIVLDTAPILGANDAIDLVGDADVMLVIARSHVTRMPAAQRAAESLRRVEAPVAGVVLVGSAEGQNSYYAEYQREATDAKPRRSGRGRKRGDSPSDEPQAPVTVSAADAADV